MSSEHKHIRSLSCIFYEVSFALFTDGTNNYIKGKDEIDAQKLKNDDIVAKGLPVVTVLIGVFSKQTGIPLAGVVNQPFASYNSETKQ